MDTNHTTLYFDKLNHILFICGYSNFWTGDLKFSKKFIQVYKIITKLINCLWCFLIMASIGLFFTQRSLTKKLFYHHAWLTSVMSGFMLFYANMMYYRKEAQELLHRLVELRAQYNDPESEQQMLKKLKTFTYMFMSLMIISVTMRGVVSFIEAIRTDDSFNPIPTAWPDISDGSTPAVIARTVIYLIWVATTLHYAGNIVLVLIILTDTCFQFKNMQSYFYGLDKIFNEQKLDEAERDEKYERHFIIGIRMHVDTLWCTNQCQRVCNVPFAVFILLILWSLVTALASLLSTDREWSSSMDVIPSGIISLLTLGFFMWNAGDITYESSRLADAIYASGWYNCRGRSSVRIRILVVNAMAQAQTPVVLQCFGIMKLSYESYLKIIKTSYTIVSVLY